MLLNSASLYDVPIMSLHSGTQLSKTIEAIIDPRTLQIVAFYCEPLDVSTELILHVSDIREVGSLGYIIDDSDKLMTLDNLVRLQDIIDMEFELAGCRVVDDTDAKLGRVIDYSYDPEDFMVQKIEVKPPLLSSLSTSSHLIGRSQIISVTRGKIIVKSPRIQNKAERKQRDQFINPFRQPAHPEPESFSSERISS